MSYQAALAFRDKVNNSPELQQRIRAEFAENKPDLVTMGKAHGFDFTMDEVMTIMQQDDVLSDFELELVSGGFKTAGNSAIFNSPRALNPLGETSSDSPSSARRGGRGIGMPGTTYG